MRKAKEIKPDKSISHSAPKSKKTESVKALRDKHLSDKNHVITDEEMKDLDVEHTPPDRSTSHTPKIPNKKNRPKDEDKDPKILTPWDTID